MVGENLYFILDASETNFSQTSAGAGCSTKEHFDLNKQHFLQHLRAHSTVFHKIWYQEFNCVSPSFPAFHDTPVARRLAEEIYSDDSKSKRYRAGKTLVSSRDKDRKDNVHLFLSSNNNCHVEDHLEHCNAFVYDNELNVCFVNKLVCLFSYEFGRSKNLKFTCETHHQRNNGTRCESCCQLYS